MGVQFSRKTTPFKLWWGRNTAGLLWPERFARLINADNLWSIIDEKAKYCSILF